MQTRQGPGKAVSRRKCIFPLQFCMFSISRCIRKSLSAARRGNLRGSGSVWSLETRVVHALGRLFGKWRNRPSRSTSRFANAAQYSAPRLAAGSCTTRVSDVANGGSSRRRPVRAQTYGIKCTSQPRYGRLGNFNLCVSARLGQGTVNWATPTCAQREKGGGIRPRRYP